MGVDIQGLHAHRANSIAYDTQGNIYEWGYRPTENFSVQTTMQGNVKRRVWERGILNFWIGKDSGCEIRKPICDCFDRKQQVVLQGRNFWCHGRIH